MMKFMTIVFLMNPAIFFEVCVWGFFKTLIDSFSLIMAILTVITFLMLGMSYYLKPHKNLKINLHLMLILSLIFFTTSSILVLYLSFETILFPILLIIIGWGYQFERVGAAFYLLVYTIFFSLPLFFVLINFFETFYISTYLFYFNLSLSVVLWFFLLPFLVKLPLYIVHLWLPKAHVEAPTVGSILLAVLLLKLGGYGIFRVFEIGMNSVFSILLVVSLTGMLFTLWVFVFQSDMKSMVAYMSVAHMNFMLFAILLFYKNVKTVYFFMMVVHGFSSGMMFFLLGGLYYFSFNRIMYFSNFSMKIFPLVSMMVGIMMVSNSAVPPFISFLPEVKFFMMMFSAQFFLFIPLTMYCLMILYSSFYFLVNLMHNTSDILYFKKKTNIYFLSISLTLGYFMLNWGLINFLM